MKGSKAGNGTPANTKDDKRQLMLFAQVVQATKIYKDNYYVALPNAIHITEPDFFFFWLNKTTTLLLFLMLHSMY